MKNYSLPVSRAKLETGEYHANKQNTDVDTADGLPGDGVTEAGSRITDHVSIRDHTLDDVVAAAGRSTSPESSVVIINASDESVDQLFMLIRDVRNLLIF